MADNVAYKVLADVSIPKALRVAGELVNGETVYETVGMTYDKGSYVLADDMTPPVRKRAQDGELDHLLAPVSMEEAMEAGYDAPVVPEHEAERVVFEQAGKTVVPRDEVMKNLSEGAEDAKKAQNEAKKDGADARPGLTAEEVPALNEGEVIVPRRREADEKKDEKSSSSEKSSAKSGKSDK